MNKMQITTIEYPAAEHYHKLKEFFNSQAAASSGNIAHSFGSPCNGPDLTIKVNNDCTTVHSLLLSIKCEDFSKWLEKHNCQTLPAIVDLTHTSLSKDGLRKMIQFLYDTGEVTVEDESARATLIAAAYFRYSELRKSLQDYSLQLVSKTKYLPKWLELADKHDVDQIYRNDLYQIAAREFPVLSKMPEMTKMPVGVIAQLLQRDDLKATSEVDTFHTALDWICGNSFSTSPNEVDQQAYRVLSVVRFVNMSSESINACLQLAKGAGCLQLVQPHVIHSDWLKTCSACNRLREADVRQNPRLYSIQPPQLENRCPWSKQNECSEPVRKVRHAAPSEGSPSSARTQSVNRKRDPSKGNVENVGATLRDDKVVPSMLESALADALQTVRTSSSADHQGDQARHPESEPSSSELLVDDWLKPGKGGSNIERETDRGTLSNRKRGPIEWKSENIGASLTAEKETSKRESAMLCVGIKEKPSADAYHQDESVQRKNALSSDAEFSGNKESADVGRPLCLHYFQKETKRLEDGSRLQRCRQMECRVNNDCCKHVEKWMPKRDQSKRSIGI